MSLQSTHPEYDKCHVDWELMDDAYKGERTVKEKRTLYLPYTASMILDGTTTAQAKGSKAYDAYITRAVFPDFVSDAVEHYIGLLHQRPAVIEVPEQMKPLLEKATNKGESLQSLLRRINEAQLTSGRIGLLADMPETPDPLNPLPYIAVYAATTIRNWDDSSDGIDVDKLNLVILDETAEERDTAFAWRQVEQYRVLALMPWPPALAPGDDSEPAPEPVAQSLQYVTALFRVKDGTDFNPNDMKPPLFRGNPLEDIPFVFVNSKDLLPQPDNPPLLGLGRLSMTIYRGEADYRQSLHQQGQDTLVVIGGLRSASSVPGSEDDDLRVGAGARIDVDVSGDAKYIGISANGIPEQRTALENDKKSASGKAGTLISPDAGKQESGDAMSTRLAAQTATLNQIAQTSAAALEKLLRSIATWMGLDPKKVKVEPNLEFAAKKFDADELVKTMTARSLGAPISLESIHDNIVQTGYTSKTFEEETQRIEEEDASRAAAQAAEPPAGSQAPGGIADPNAPPTPPGE